MSYSESIVFTLTPFRKTRNTTLRPIGVKYLSTTSDDLVSIRLMPHIPDELIIWSVKNIMQSDRQFYHSQTRSEVTISNLRNNIDDILPDLVGYLREVFDFELLTHITRELYLREKRTSEVMTHKVYFGNYPHFYPNANTFL